MDSALTSLSGTIRSELVHLDGVTKFSPNRRFATVFSETSPADTLFFLESGLVKLSKRGEESKEIILQIVIPGELFGVQAITDPARELSAEVLQEGVIYVIPRDLFTGFCDERPHLWRLFAEVLIGRKRQLEKKIELLCLKDVEYRILYYMAELAATLGGRQNGSDYIVPLSQGELASLIGATRETTSTTLNSLARRGLIRLGRRQLVVPSLDEVRAAAKDRPVRATAVKA